MNEPILIIDDDEIFCDVLADALNKRGMQTFVAHSIHQTQDVLLTVQPHYAVVDLRIGDESGLKVCEMLLQKIPDISIVILTGYASIATAVEAIKLGVKNYLTKPTDVESILSVLKNEDANADVAIPDNPLPVKRLEWEHLQKVLMENDGNISKAAEKLGMHRRTLQRKLKKRPVKEKNNLSN